VSLIGIVGAVTSSPLPHHRTGGSHTAVRTLPFSSMSPSSETVRRPCVLRPSNPEGNFEQFETGRLMEIRITADRGWGDFWCCRWNPKIKRGTLWHAPHRMIYSAANRQPSRLKISRKTRRVSFKRFSTLTLFTPIALAMPAKSRMDRLPRMCGVFCRPLAGSICVPQGFFRPQSSNGFEHAGLFLHEMREGGYLLQQIAGNEFPFSGISVAAPDAIKLCHIFDTLNIPVLLDENEMESSRHERL
jgi:hypothetical protein